jgi:AcrR family transcriptional regulator
MAAPKSGGRPLRADARRKRDAILMAAVPVFLERGIDVALEEVARRADVGIATLYRHFPTREALITGAYAHEVEQLCGGVDELLATLPPDEALVAWMRHFIGYVAGMPGMGVALKHIVCMPEIPGLQEIHRRIDDTVRRLLTAAEDSGTIGPGASSEDLAAALTGLCLIADQPDAEARAGRLASLLVDGLRYGAP